MPWGASGEVNAGTARSGTVLATPAAQRQPEHPMGLGFRVLKMLGPFCSYGAYIVEYRVEGFSKFSVTFSL